MVDYSINRIGGLMAGCLHPVFFVQVYAGDGDKKRADRLNTPPATQRPNFNPLTFFIVFMPPPPGF